MRGRLLAAFAVGVVSVVVSGSPASADRLTGCDVVETTYTVVVNCQRVKKSTGADRLIVEAVGECTDGDTTIRKDGKDVGALSNSTVYCDRANGFRVVPGSGDANVKPGKRPPRK